MTTRLTPRTRIFNALTLAVLALAACLATAAPAVAATNAANTATLNDLLAAYDGESNAHARYAAFAEKADAEGYAAVGSLFRAAASAEKIHAENHAVVIRSLGGEPAAKVETPSVGTSAENLAAAIGGETYERDTMYPEFIARARALGNKDSIKTFNYAKTAEAEHARLYQESLDGLDQLAGSQPVTYYVCSVCGFTTTNLDFTKCVSCFSPKEKYVAVA